MQYMHFWAYTLQYLCETPVKVLYMYTKSWIKTSIFGLNLLFTKSLWTELSFTSSYFVNFQSESDKRLVDKVNKLVAILGGETTIALHLEFLIRNNHADLLILKNTKVSESPQAMINYCKPPK